MEEPNTVLAFIRTVLKTVLYAWIARMGELLQDIGAQRERWKRRRCQSERVRRTPPQPCVRLSDPAYKRPDPMIYSQYYLMQLGFAVTWDNPDIEIYKDGMLVPSHSLEPDTEYEVAARIWNNSSDAPIVGLPVHLAYLSFGVGTELHFIGQTHVNLGVKGGPNHPALARVPWRTPPQAGHYCVQVGFEWIDDLNPNNNLGQENLDVGIAHSPAEFDFQLRNDTERRQSYHFEVDTYTLPPQEPCSDTPRVERQATAWERKTYAVSPRHQRNAYPVPPGWRVEISPAALALDAGDETTVRVAITPPEDFGGQQPFNIHAFHQQGLAGGVSLLVQRA